jgi:predicted porin
MPLFSTLEITSMKKTLIALAAVAATGAAFAQSSVTLYGVADVSVAKATGAKVAASANGLLNNGNSRWGLKGSEDLGGGLKANFVFEAGVNLATGATDANTFQRNAFLELAGNFGSVRAGRSLSPTFYGIAAYELTGAANYAVIGSQFAFTNSTRNDAMIAYTTPSMGGLTATLGVKLAGNNAGKQKIDSNVIYKSGPVIVGFTYAKVDGEKKSVSLGGSYDLGTVKLAAGFFDPNDARKGFSLGASAPLGPVTLTFDMARDTGSAVKSTDYVLEGKYALSKRTFAYGVLHRDGSAKVNTYGVGVRHNF